jgi:hypothetical protein
MPIIHGISANQVNNIHQQTPYNIPPLPGSIQFDLASPDTEKAGQTLPRPQISASTFLHQDIVQLDHKNMVRQIVVCTVHCNIPEPQLD